MTEEEGRAAVVEAARAWLGTPYHHLGDIRGVGVDCAMLLVRVYVDLGLIEPFDPRPYSPDWMLHNGEERYLTLLLARSREIPRASVGPGDFILFRFGRCFSHGGIVTKTDPLTMVHAFMPARRVIEDEPERSELGIRLQTAKFASYWG
ncbi:hypothetical protein DFR50_14244 [Roseiarcus fermentans]|uniref:NlpC/P60 domain-containing protein n=1 Tax=Roseiarcus fermentans TaxID=1473586 RepID=A0A366EP93_9HYPH|nr:hypothetical protein [Roseiarcus fermentans]RBP03796.1 hypothetical protein DFR50_14244 [Roseiarcus fermentans]